jgi:hypothetical protein
VVPRHPTPPLSAKTVLALVAEFDARLRADLDETIERMRDAESGKIVLNSDDLFRILPRYEAHPEERMVLGPLLYPTARDFTDEIYACLLNRPFGENDTVVFTAGGSATGKSSILRSACENLGVAFIVDTTFSNAARALDQVDRALASGRKVEIHYVYREFRDSITGMIHRALDRRSGRIVPVDDMARTHFGAQRALLQVMRKYLEDPRVSVILSENVGGKLRPLSELRFGALLHGSVDALAKLGQAVLDEFREIQKGRWHPDGADHDAGGGDLHFSKAFYEAARSKTQGGRESAGEADAGTLRTSGPEGEAARSAASQDPSR